MRLNKGITSGKYLGRANDEWAIYQTQKDRYKVCSLQPIAGKANYSFEINKGRRIDTHAKLDAHLLKNERAELYDAIERFFAQWIPEQETFDETTDADPYGDLALGRKQALNTDQNWKRGLLNMRRIELEHAALKHDVRTWETGVRMLHAGVYKTKISDADLKKAVAYIERRAGPINLDALLGVEQDLYAGKYRPNSCATLEVQLDLLAGDPGRYEDLL